MTGMLCLICRQAETVNGFTSVIFERDEMKLVVNNVPAWVCPGCEDAYVEADVAVRLLRRAEAMSVEGELDREVEYNGAN
jgi:YgiT-type zinc finger domain-containing protein